MQIQILTRTLEVQRGQREAQVRLTGVQRLLGAGDARRGENLTRIAEVAHPYRMADAGWEFLPIMPH